MNAPPTITYGHLEKTSLVEVIIDNKIPCVVIDIVIIIFINLKLFKLIIIMRFQYSYQ
jgi:hypothetical protein